MARKAKGSGSRERKEEGRRGQKSQGGKDTEMKKNETRIARREQAAGLSPFSLMRRFSEEMDRLFGGFNFGGGFASGVGREFGRLADLESSMWLPQVEAFEREGKLVVRADLPGLTKDDIKVDITDDGITIRGERRQEKEESDAGYFRSERSYGSFYREIPLPAGVNSEEARATFNNGVLEVIMPAPEKRSTSRRIEIGGKAETEPERKALGKAAGR